MADDAERGWAVLDLIEIAESQQFLLRSEREKLAKAKVALQPLIDAAIARAHG
jgi:hypothetical protein